MTVASEHRDAVERQYLLQVQRTGNARPFWNTLTLHIIQNLLECAEVTTFVRNFVGEQQVGC
jgi:hypothetical protein